MDSGLKPEGESLCEQSNEPDVADGCLPAYLYGGCSAERPSNSTLSAWSFLTLSDDSTCVYRAIVGHPVRMTLAVHRIYDRQVTLTRDAAK